MQTLQAMLAYKSFLAVLVQDVGTQWKDAAMATLSAQARETLKDAGIGPARWIKIHGNKGTCAGDKCGCSDDRCISYHHDELDECECLPAMIETYFKEQRAIEDGKEVWTAHLNALETGSSADEEAAASKAALWVEAYQGSRIIVSYSLTEIADGKQGISVMNIFNDTRWLVWDAAAMTVETAMQ